MHISSILKIHNIMYTVLYDHEHNNCTTVTLKTKELPVVYNVYTVVTTSHGITAYRDLQVG